MNLFNRIKIIGPVGLWLAASVGTATAATGPAAPNPTESEAAACAQANEQKSDAHGVVALVGGALAKLCLTDEQRASIEQLGKVVAPKEKEVSGARHALVLVLAEQLKSGQIDERALEDNIAALVKARESASPVLRSALESLHGILTPEQRVTFVDTIQARMKELADAADGYFDKFVVAFGLSDLQKDHVHEALAKAKPELRAERATAAATFIAFKGADFSMEKMSPIAKVGERTRERVEGMLCIAKDLAIILTAEQRAILAEKLENRHAQRGASEVACEAPSPDDAEHVCSTAQGLVSGPEPERVGATQEEFVAARRSVGVVGGWGRGGFARSATVVRGGGFATGYPIVGGYGPGVW